MSHYDIVETFDHKGYRVEIQRDGYPDAPDDEDSNLFLVALHHRQFWRLPPRLVGQIRSHEDWARWMEVHADEYEFIQVYAYIHSGVKLGLKRDHYPFTDPWDTSDCVFIARSKREAFGEGVDESFIETWNQYLSGDVYGCVILDPWDHEVDSLWGLYGLDYAREEALQMAKHLPAIRCLHEKIDIADTASAEDGQDLVLYVRCNQCGQTGTGLLKSKEVKW